MSSAARSCPGGGPHGGERRRRAAWPLPSSLLMNGPHRQMLNAAHLSRETSGVTRRQRPRPRIPHGGRGPASPMRATLAPHSARVRPWATRAFLLLAARVASHPIVSLAPLDVRASPAVSRISRGPCAPTPALAGPGRGGSWGLCRAGCLWPCVRWDLTWGRVVRWRAQSYLLRRLPSFRGYRIPHVPLRSCAVDVVRSRSVGHLHCWRSKALSEIRVVMRLSPWAFGGRDL